MADSLMEPEDETALETARRFTSPAQFATPIRVASQPLVRAAPRVTSQLAPASPQPAGPAAESQWPELGEQEDLETLLEQALRRAMGGSAPLPPLLPPNSPPSLGGPLNAARSRRTDVFEQQAERAAINIVQPHDSSPNLSRIFGVRNDPKAIAAQSLDDLPQPLAQTLSRARGGGHSLPEGPRQRLEQHFGTDLSGVRIHTGPGAIQVAHGLNAKAVTAGQDIFFNAAQFDPQSHSGLSLLAHEVAHTLQQGHGPPGAQQVQLAPTQAGNPTVEEILRCVIWPEARSRVLTWLSAAGGSALGSVSGYFLGQKIKSYLENPEGGAGVNILVWGLALLGALGTATNALPRPARILLLYFIFRGLAPWAGASTVESPVQFIGWLKSKIGGGGTSTEDSSILEGISEQVSEVRSGFFTGLLSQFKNAASAVQSIYGALTEVEGFEIDLKFLNLIVQSMVLAERTSDKVQGLISQEADQVGGLFIDAGILLRVLGKEFSFGAKPGETAQVLFPFQSSTLAFVKVNLKSKEILSQGDVLNLISVTKLTLDELEVRNEGVTKAELSIQMLSILDTVMQAKELKASWDQDSGLEFSSSNFILMIPGLPKLESGFMLTFDQNNQFQEGEATDLKFGQSLTVKTIQLTRDEDDRFQLDVTQAEWTLPAFLGLGENSKLTFDTISLSQKALEGSVSLTLPGENRFLGGGLVFKNTTLGASLTEDSWTVTASTDQGQVNIPGLPSLSAGLDLKFTDGKLEKGEAREIKAGDSLHVQGLSVLPLTTAEGDGNGYELAVSQATWTPDLGLGETTFTFQQIKVSREGIEGTATFSTSNTLSAFGDALSFQNVTLTAELSKEGWMVSAGSGGLKVQINKPKVDGEVKNISIAISSKTMGEEGERQRNLVISADSLRLTLADRLELTAGQGAGGVSEPVEAGQAGSGQKGLIFDLVAGEANINKARLELKSKAKPQDEGESAGGFLQGDSFKGESPWLEQLNPLSGLPLGINLSSIGAAVEVHSVVVTRDGVKFSRPRPVWPRGFQDLELDLFGSKLRLGFNEGLEFSKNFPELEIFSWDSEAALYLPVVQGLVGVKLALVLKLDLTAGASLKFQAKKGTQEIPGFGIGLEGRAEANLNGSVGAEAGAYAGIPWVLEGSAGVSAAAVALSQNELSLAGFLRYDFEDRMWGTDGHVTLDFASINQLLLRAGIFFGIKIVGFTKKKTITLKEGKFADLTLKGNAKIPLPRNGQSVIFTPERIRDIISFELNVPKALRGKNDNDPLVLEAQAKINELKNSVKRVRKLRQDAQDLSKKIDTRKLGTGGEADEIFQNYRMKIDEIAKLYEKLDNSDEFRTDRIEARIKRLQEKIEETRDLINSAEIGAVKFREFLNQPGEEPPTEKEKIRDSSSLASFDQIVKEGPADLKLLEDQLKKLNDLKKAATEVQETIGKNTQQGLGVDVEES